MFGYQLVAKTVAELGFRHVFGLMGNGNLPWLAYGVDQNLFNYISVRHEATSVCAAAGYARASGGVGLATVTHGPGLGNTFTALTAAVRDNSPIVVLIGVPPLNHPTAIQRMDHRQFTELCGAVYHQVEEPEKMSAVLAQAAHLATLTKKPQVVGIYNDDLEKEVVSADMPLPSHATRTDRRVPPADDIACAIDMLAEAKWPVIVAGQGAVFSDARSAIEELGDELGAVYGETQMARHFFAGNKKVVGLIGISSHPMTDKWLKAADCVLVVGASLNASQTKRFKLFEGKRVIQIENTVSNIPAFHKVDFTLIGDAQATVLNLIGEWRRRKLGRRVGARTDQLLAALARHYPHCEEDDISDDDGLDPRTVYMHLEKVLPENRLIVTDGGRAMETLHHLVSAPDAQSYLWTSGFASIGMGLGAAIGAGKAKPDRPLVLIAGDGGFTMTAQELDTIHRSGMQILIFVMNDLQYGSEVRHIAHLHHRGHHVTMAAAQFDASLPLDALARAYGGGGQVIETKQDLDNFQVTPEKLQGLYLVDVRIQRKFDVWIEWSPKKFI